MSILQAIILGIVQGLTEFIPVSSSGHLVIAHDILGVTENGLAFDVALHVGTLLALLIYFRQDIWQLLRALVVRSTHTKLAYLIIVATIPAVVAGFMLSSAAESAFRSTKLVAFNLILVAFLMIGAEWYAKRFKNKTSLEEISTRQALTVGVAQAAALVPGVSRSGSTITAGIFSGIDRVAATRLSFLLGIPTILGAIVKIMSDSQTTQLIVDQKAVFIAGILSAFISGLAAIVFLLRYLSRHSLNIFAYYRIALGVLILFLAYLR
jgi:undecaprenyl-diphosphatase